MVRRTSNADNAEKNAILEKLKEKMSASKSGGQGGFYKLTEGSTMLRILPPVGEMEKFYQDVGKHYIPNADTIICPLRTTERVEDCPICELNNILRNSTNEVDKDLSSKIYMRRSYYMNIVVREDGDKDGDTAKGPFVFTPGVKIYNSVYALVFNPEYGDISRANEGLDIIIERIGLRKDNTEYEVIPRRNNSYLHAIEEEQDRILEEAKDLSYVMLTDDPAEDSQFKDFLVQVMPYDRIIEQYGIGPNMDIALLTNTQEAEEVETPLRPVRGTEIALNEGRSKVSDLVEARIKRAQSKRGR